MFIMGKERDYIVHNDTEVKGFFGEYRWLSNFHPCDIIFEDNYYPSSENAYQAARCADLSQRALFLDCSPSKAKQLAKTVITRENWSVIKYDIMSAVVFDKFYRNFDLRLKLLETKRKYLEETNHWGDAYWGVCKDKGENKLGKIIMGTRAIWNSK